MVFRAEFRNFRAVTTLVLVLAALVMGTAAVAHDARLALIGAGIVGALVWVRLRVRLVLTEDDFEYVGPVFRRRVEWAAITRERSVLEAGYPTDRLFGPFVHEFWTSDGVTRVSFLFFPRGSLKEVLSRAKVRSTKA